MGDKSPKSTQKIANQKASKSTTARNAMSAKQGAMGAKAADKKKK